MRIRSWWPPARSTRVGRDHGLGLSRRLAVGLTGLALVAAVAATAGTSASAAAMTSKQLDLKILLIGGVGGATSDPTTAAWTSTLTREGVPFTQVNAVGATVGSETVALPALSSGNIGYYNAVVLADAPADFAAGQLTALDTYEATFGVRQLDGYVSPTTALGETAVTAGATLDGTTATLTPAGLAAFPELTGTVIFDTGTFGYPTTAVAGAPFTPFLDNGSGDVLAGVYSHPSTDPQAGVEELVLNFAYNANQLQWLVLGPSLINWVTQDTHLGLYRNYIEVDVDDVFTPDDVWDATTHQIDYSDADALRMTPADVVYAAEWEAQNNFRLDMLYNGGGSAAVQESGPDALLAQFQATDPVTGKPYADDFGWLSHTYDTPYLDVGCATQDYIEAEINENNTWAEEAGSGGTGGLGLAVAPSTSYALGYIDPKTFVPGNHSGFADLVPGNPATVDPPDLDASNTVASGGTLAAGEYAYAVTDQFADGGTAPATLTDPATDQSEADVVLATITAGQEVELNWQAICHASDYIIYRTDAPLGVIDTSGWEQIGYVTTPQVATLPDTSSGNPTGNSTTNVSGGGELEQSFTDTGAAGTAVADSVAEPTTEGATELPWEQNSYFLDALEALGITAVGDDASKAYPDPSTTEFGIGAAYPTGDLEYAAGEPFVEGTTSQVVPRIPNDIYYDTATQAQELDEFLTIEAGQTPYDTYNFADIVGFVDSGLFQDMMSNDPDPTYVHQTNIIGSPPGVTSPPADSNTAGQGILYSALNQLLTEYHQYINASAPYDQLTMGAIATTLAEQGAWATTETAGTVTASETNGVITVDNTGGTAATVPVTAPPGTIVGTSGTTAFGQSYGGTLSTWVPLGAGGTETLSGPPSQPDLPMGTAEPSAVSLSWTAPTNTGGDPLTSYVITPYLGTTALAPITVASTVTSYTITGLTDGDAYTFKVAATSLLGTGLASLPSAAVTPTAPAAATYNSLTPYRVCDTRAGTTTSDTAQCAGKTLAPGATLTIPVAGTNPAGATSGGVPSTATSVVLNVTVTDTTAASYLTVWPAGGAMPLASSVNWSAGQTVPNLVTVAVGTGGDVSFYNDLGNVDVVVDVEGWFDSTDTTGGPYVPLTPYRGCDTRAGNPSGLSGVDSQCGGKTLGAKKTITIQVAGTSPSGATSGGIPAGAIAADLTVTATDTSTPSYLTVWPAGVTQPLASNLNFVAGETVANNVVVALPTTGAGAGEVSIYNANGSSDVVVDVSGYYSTTGAAPSGATDFTPMVPYRICDTRATAVSGLDDACTGYALEADSSFAVTFAGVGGIPANATAVVLNVTVTDTTAADYLTVYPAGGAKPFSSNLNWSPGETVASGVTATLGASGALDFYIPNGKADLVVDVVGWEAP